MPVLDAPGRATPQFEVSTAVDLFWSLMEAGAEERRPHERDEHLAQLLSDNRLVRRVISFWDDGPDDFSELLVLAAEGGVLTGALGGDQVVSSVSSACQVVAPDPPLRTETDTARAIIRRRLAKLSADRRTRRRYTTLLSDVWAAVEDDWRRRGLRLAERAVAACRVRAARGEPWAGLLEKTESLDSYLADSFARAAGSPVIVAVSPYGGALLLDLTSVQLIGLRVRSAAADPRERAAGLARRLRALSDPTRLAMVELLAQAPSTVGDLARLLDVAQPTVSNHVKLLREAGVVRLDRTEGRQRIVVDAAGLQELLEEVAGRLGSAR